MLDALIKNKKISKNQALEIIEKSKKAGGILISGYNVVVLDIEIMTTLIKNNFLDVKTAQSVIDSAKHPTPLKDSEGKIIKDKNGERILTEDGKWIITEDGKRILKK